MSAKDVRYVMVGCELLFVYCFGLLINFVTSRQRIASPELRRRVPCHPRILKCIEQLNLEISCCAVPFM